MLPPRDYRLRLAGWALVKPLWWARPTGSFVVPEWSGREGGSHEAFPCTGALGLARASGPGRRGALRLGERELFGCHPRRYAYRVLAFVGLPQEGMYQWKGE